MDRLTDIVDYIKNIAKNLKGDSIYYPIEELFNHHRIEWVYYEDFNYGEGDGAQRDGLVIKPKGYDLVIVLTVHPDEIFTKTVSSTDVYLATSLKDGDLPIILSDFYSLEDLFQQTKEKINTDIGGTPNHTLFFTSRHGKIDYL